MSSWDPNRIADQRSDEEKATSSTTASAGPGNAAASAWVVLFGAVVLAATAARTSGIAPARALLASPTAWIAANVIRWVVRVPVLSVQNVSIRLMASIALWRCASAPSREIRRAAAAYVTVS